eukprot:PhM_4_TR14270/c1_g1_i1/m.4950/K07151/STT3; dolichyl-diphosphooligosaccharide--protein glycosyltransferase
MLSIAFSGVVLLLSIALSLAMRSLSVAQYGPVLYDHNAHETFAVADAIFSSTSLDERSFLPPSVMQNVLKALFSIPMLRGGSSDVRHTASVWLAPVVDSVVSLFLVSRLATMLNGGNEVAGRLAGLFYALCPAIVARSMAGSLNSSTMQVPAILTLLISHVSALPAGRLPAIRGCMTGFLLAALHGCAETHTDVLVAEVTTCVLFVHLLLTCLWRALPQGMLSNMAWYGLTTALSCWVLTGFGVHLTYRVFVLQTVVSTIAVVVSCAAWFSVTRIGAATSKVERNAWRLKVVVWFLVLCACIAFVAQHHHHHHDHYDDDEVHDVTPHPSAHRAFTWATVFFEFGPLVFLMPCGLYLCFRDFSTSDVLVIEGMLLSCALQIQSPASEWANAISALCFVLLSSTAVAWVLEAHGVWLRDQGTHIVRDSVTLEVTRTPHSAMRMIVSTVGALSTWLVLSALCFGFVVHSAWVVREAHVMPSLVLTNVRGEAATDHIEALAWIRQHSPKDAVFASLGDHAMPVVSTGRRHHILETGCPQQRAITHEALLLREDVAVHRLKKLGATHLLVVFGGVFGCADDDFGRIAGLAEEAAATGRIVVHPSDFTTKIESVNTLAETLLFKALFHRFEGKIGDSGVAGYDAARETTMPKSTLRAATPHHLKEVFCSQQWLVRIFEV